MTEFKLPDTGQVESYNKKGEVINPDIKDNYYGQDGCFKFNPMSFIKLNEVGKEIADSSFWDDNLRAVKDQNTGLIWEVKSPVEGDLNFAADKYTWQELEEGYIKKLNQANYAGRSDWRVPNRDELKSIITYDRVNPALDTWYFPNTNNGLHWTSYTYKMQPYFAYVVSMGLGSATAISKESERPIRAVAGGYDALFGEPNRDRFVDNGDNTITDRTTNLMWQKGENDKMSWFDAVRTAQEMELAGYDDWRLPSIKELNTILDLNYENDSWYFNEYFPAEGLEPPLLHYYSSTSFQNTYAWVTNFCFGYDGYYANKNMPLLFRAVRSIEEGNQKEESVFRLPATGQQKLYDDEGNILTDLSGEDKFFGQDGCYEFNSLSYTKLRARGVEIKEDLSWEKGFRMVKDDNTGLIWEVKSPDKNDLNYCHADYSWKEAQEYIKELNKKQYGGFDDWRLPLKEELRTIVDYSKPEITINENFFPHTRPEFYWSGDKYLADPKLIWGIYFGFGCGIAYLKDLKYPLRAVRQGIIDGFGDKDKYDFVDNEDGTITDQNTGLMWKQDESPAMNWESALEYCENLELAGYDDWRLPNQKELATILDLSYQNQSWFFADYFPDTKTKPLGFYMASSTFNETFGWGINFQFAYDGYYADKKNGVYPFRPVRSTKN
ncbi:MAG: DUF1566 domain-containing protein [Bacillota bacterium]